MADIAERDELLTILTERARAGNVAAAKALLDELRREDGDEDSPASTLDALDNVTPIRKLA